MPPSVGIFGHVVAVGKPCGDSRGFGWDVGQARHEVLHGHGGDERVARKLLALAVLFVNHGRNRAVGSVAAEGDGLRAEEDFAAELADLVRRDVPELAGAELRVGELLDERGLNGAAFLPERLEKGVLHDGEDGHALDALRAPRGVDLRGMPAPEVLRVVLEKHRVELLPEPVDVEVLERLLLSPEDCGLEIAEPGHDRRPQAHVRECRGLERDRIVEELAVEEYARDAVAAEHNAVGFLRVRPARGERARAAEPLVVE